MEYHVFVMSCNTDAEKEMAEIFRKLSPENQGALLVEARHFHRIKSEDTRFMVVREHLESVQALWLTLSETVLIELEQSANEGRDVRSCGGEARQIFADYQAGYLHEEDARILIDRIRGAPIVKGYSYIEPDSLDDIRAARPVNSAVSLPVKIESAAYYDKVYGAWLGRCCGCLLGQPVEGWYRDRIAGMLRDTNNYPITRYLASDVGDKLRKKYQISDEGRVYGGKIINWINNISCCPEDDDTNYTILYLKILEEFGSRFTSEDVIYGWLMNIPFFHVCTAERVAYRNFTNLIPPPLSGSYYNAYREWVGAQIRADFFGYICPGDTEKAAEYAWRDGRISHTKNGIYGEMFCAAAIARAAVSMDIWDIIKNGLGQIPEKSRLAEGVKKVFAWHEEGQSWEEAVQSLHRIYDEKNNHHWCHAVTNAMVCVIALLWGEEDFEKTIGIAVCAGFDTDCNAATVGSIIGMITGAKELPEKWVKPLNNKVKSGIDGFALTEISGLARKTAGLARIFASPPAQDSRQL
jgi:ADP-ribosylglycohydrolase